MADVFVFQRWPVSDRGVEARSVVRVHPGRGFPLQLGSPGADQVPVDQLGFAEREHRFQERVIEGDSWRVAVP